MSRRRTQAFHLGRLLSDRTGVTVELQWSIGAKWYVMWGNGPTVRQMRDQVEALLDQRDFDTLRDRELDYQRGDDNRAWATRAVAVHRDGTLAQEVRDYVAWRHDIREPAWSDLTIEDHGVLRYVDRLVDETPYPDQASDPADEVLIEQLLAVADNKYKMTQILLDPDLLNTISTGAPTRDEWNARLETHRNREAER